MHPREQVVAELVDRYRASESPEEKNELFRQIAEWLVPLIVSTIAKYRWDATLNESPNSLVNEAVIKLPVILQKFKPENGSFYNYFMSGLLNCFRHLYAKRVRRAKYHGDWPLDEEGNPAEMADTEGEKITGYAKRLLRGQEYERLMSEIPRELSALVNEEYGGIVHYIAERYLVRADNREQLYFTELRKEVSALPVSKSLSEREVDSLIRMVVAGVRSRLYALHTSKVEEESSIEMVRDLLRAGSYRLWPLLIILQPEQTLMLLHCLGGVHDSVPARDRWFRESSRVCPVAVTV